MQGIKNWSFNPYVPVRQRSDIKTPYVTAVRPDTSGFEFEWLGSGTGCSVFYRRRYTDKWTEKAASPDICRVNGLVDFSDYEFYLSDGANKSTVRLVRTGGAPKSISPVSIINYLHPDDKAYSFSGQYAASPSVVKLSDGTLIASHDIFRSSGSQNLTILFKSCDGGKSWRYLTELFPCFWGRLFLRGETLYMLAVSCEYGDLIVGASCDGGKTWGMPTVIGRGSCSSASGFHRAPMPFVHAGGRMWTDVQFGSWSDKGFSVMLLSIADGDNPLDASSWLLTEPAELPSEVFSQGSAIEGNAVLAPDGNLYDILRITRYKAAVFKCDMNSPEKKLEFTELRDFPMGHSKFEIQKADNGFYYAVGNTSVPWDGPLPLRNVLSLYKSPDLIKWKPVLDIFDYRQYDKTSTGFQYPSFVFDGNEMLLTVRTAYNGAENYHDSNMITFQKINYR